MREIGYQVFGAGLALLGIGIALPSIIQAFREISKTKNKTNKFILIISICLIGIGFTVAGVGFAALATC